MTPPAHLAFVLERALGHIAHAANLRQALADDDAARISWLPIDFHTDDRLRHLPLLRRNWSLTASLMARRELNRLLRQGPVDALFFHTQVTAFGALDLMRTRPTIISLDATPLAFDSIGAAYGHRPDGRLAGPKQGLTRALFRRATAFVTWSAWARRSLVDDYGIAPERVHVIAPGTDLDLWAVERSAPADPGRPVRILFVGGDFERKGGADLLAACGPLLPNRCELHLVTRADVPARPGVVVHAGLQPNSPALRRLYAEADLFALPSYAEGLPMAVMEAMAAGLPVIATDITAMAEAVRHGQTGLLVQPGDVAELRAAVSSLIEAPERRRAMGEAGRRLAERDFDAATNARRVRELLLSAVAERRARPHGPAALLPAAGLKFGEDRPTE